MTNESGRNNQDQARPDAVRWELGIPGEYKNHTLWRCDALRAGKLYNRSLFGTREEAEEFAQKMRRAEPDQMFNVESIKASTVWN